MRLPFKTRVWDSKPVDFLNFMLKVLRRPWAPALLDKTLVVT